MTPTKTPPQLPVVVDIVCAQHVADEAFGKRYGTDWIWHADGIGYLYPSDKEPSEYAATLAAAAGVDHVASVLLDALIDCRRALELANFTEELAVVDHAIELANQADAETSAPTLGSQPFDRAAIMQGAEALAKLYALMQLVEGPGCKRWEDGNGFRLKDTQEWVEFYCLVKRLQNLEQSSEFLSPASPPVEGQGVEPWPLDRCLEHPRELGYVDVDGFKRWVSYNPGAVSQFIIALFHSLPLDTIRPAVIASLTGSPNTPPEGHSVEQRARELLAREYDKVGGDFAAKCLRERIPEWGDAPAIRAIVAALDFGAQPAEVVQRLRDAIEGECGGLGISTESALSILEYIGFDPRGRIVGGRDIEGLWVIEATAISDLMPNHKLVRYEDHLRITAALTAQAPSEAVAEAVDVGCAPEVSIHIRWLKDWRDLPPGTKLYAGPQARGVIPEGWHIIVEEDEARVCAPNADPGAVIVPKCGGRIESRLLYALASALIASASGVKSDG